MSPKAKNYAIAFFAASTVGLGIQLFNTRQQLTAARQAPTLEIKSTNITTAAAPAPIAAPSAPASEPASDLSLERPEFGGPGSGPGAEGGNRRGGGGARFAAQMAELMKDPEFAAAMKIEQEARIEQRYGAVFKQLNLPADQLSALKALLIERDNAGRDVWTSAAAQGLNPRESRDQLRQLTSELQAEVDANIKATFGEKVVSAFEAYNAAAPQRATINDLTPKLTLVGQPLNDSQSQQLTRILAETGTTSGRNTLVTDATISRAQAVLTPAQVNALREVQAQQQARQVINDKTRVAREQAQSGRTGN